LKAGAIDLAAFVAARMKGWRTFAKTCVHSRRIGNGMNWNPLQLRLHENLSRRFPATWTDILASLLNRKVYYQGVNLCVFRGGL